MSLDAIFGLLFAALFGLIGVVWRIVWTKLQKIEESIQNIDSGALAQFQAKDGERERAWWEWRSDVAKRLDSHATDLRDHDKRLTKMERNGH